MQMAPLRKGFNAVNGIRRRTTKTKKVVKATTASFNAVNGIRRRTTRRSIMFSINFDEVSMP